MFVVYDIKLFSVWTGKLSFSVTELDRTLALRFDNNIQNIQEDCMNYLTVICCLRKHNKIYKIQCS